MEGSRSGSVSLQIITDADLYLGAQKIMDPTALDLEHWLNLVNIKKTV
jgi:hypothetical protein